MNFFFKVLSTTVLEHEDAKNRLSFKDRIGGEVKEYAWYILSGIFFSSFAVKLSANFLQIFQAAKF